SAETGGASKSAPSCNPCATTHISIQSPSLLIYSFPAVYPATVVPMVSEEAIPQSDMAGGDPPASNFSPNATYSSVPPNVTTRVAFVLIDGIGDVAVPLLGGLTPLEAAHTPNLDAIAAAGVNGLMDPVEPGLACGSDTAHFSLLQLQPPPCQHYRGGESM
ncbi:unnamed protein product, partial [Closterium sp. NIES-53]